MDDEIEIVFDGSEIADYWTYLKSIDWYDPWIFLLLIIHSVIIMVVAKTRKHSLFQMILFLGMLLTVFMSEKINNLATKHQHLFSQRQNFDRHGLFISTVFSVPILLNCMLMIINWLHTATDVMSTMRSAQVKAANNKIYNNNNNNFTSGYGHKQR